MAWMSNYNNTHLCGCNYISKPFFISMLVSCSHYRCKNSGTLLYKQCSATQPNRGPAQFFYLYPTLTSNREAWLKNRSLLCNFMRFLQRIGMAMAFHKPPADMLILPPWRPYCTVPDGHRPQERHVIWKHIRIIVVLAQWFLSIQSQLHRNRKGLDLHS